MVHALVSSAERISISLEMQPCADNASGVWSDAGLYPGDRGGRVQTTVAGAPCVHAVCAQHGVDRQKSARSLGFPFSCHGGHLLCGRKALFFPDGCGALQPEWPPRQKIGADEISATCWDSSVLTSVREGRAIVCDGGQPCADSVSDPRFDAGLFPGLRGDAAQLSLAGVLRHRAIRTTSAADDRKFAGLPEAPVDDTDCDHLSSATAPRGPDDHEGLQFGTVRSQKNVVGKISVGSRSGTCRRRQLEVLLPGTRSDSAPSTAIANGPAPTWVAAQGRRIPAITKKQMNCTSHLGLPRGSERVPHLTERRLPAMGSCRFDPRSYLPINTAECHKKTVQYARGLPACKSPCLFAHEEMAARESRFAIAPVPRPMAQPRARDVGTFLMTQGWFPWPEQQGMAQQGEAVRAHLVAHTLAACGTGHRKCIGRGLTIPLEVASSRQDPGTKSTLCPETGRHSQKVWGRYQVTMSVEVSGIARHG